MMSDAIDRRPDGPHRTHQERLAREIRWERGSGVGSGAVKHGAGLKPVMVV